MRVAFLKSTNEPINDFQSLATEEGLISNAVKNGIPEKDIEVREVTKEEYQALEEQVNGEARAMYLADEEVFLVTNDMAVAEGVEEARVEAMAEGELDAS